MPGDGRDAPSLQLSCWTGAGVAICLWGSPTDARGCPAPPSPLTVLL